MVICRRHVCYQQSISTNNITNTLSCYQLLRKYKIQFWERRSICYTHTLLFFDLEIRRNIRNIEFVVYRRQTSTDWYITADYQRFTMKDQPHKVYEINNIEPHHIVSLTDNVKQVNEVNNPLRSNAYKDEYMEHMYGQKSKSHEIERMQHCIFHHFENLFSIVQNVDFTQSDSQFRVRRKTYKTFLWKWYYWRQSKHCSGGCVFYRLGL